MTAAYTSLCRLLLVITLLASSTSRCQIYDEQRIFDAETLTVKHPVPIPQDVLGALLKDLDVQQVLEADKVPGKTIPKDWLTASSISTVKSRRRLLLVIGKGPLAGAHGTTFWLFAEQGLLLKITADRLQIGKADSSGYPTLTAVELTAISIRDLNYHFVSGKYVAFHHTR